MSYFPIHIYQKTKAILNSYEFIITVVVGNKDNNKFLPGYICQYNTIIEIANDSTNVIFEVYSKIFIIETHHSSLLIMGWNDKSIVEKLRKNVSFIS